MIVTIICWMLDEELYWWNYFPLVAIESIFWISLFLGLGSFVENYRV